MTNPLWFLKSSELDTMADDLLEDVLHDFACARCPHRTDGGPRQSDLGVVRDTIRAHLSSAMKTSSRREARDASLELDGVALPDALRPDAPQGSVGTMVLHAVAREFGWRTDWTTGSPITLQAVVDEIRRRQSILGGVPMLLWCPVCHARHLDAEGLPRRTHECRSCGARWQVQFLPGSRGGA